MKDIRCCWRLVALVLALMLPLVALFPCIPARAEKVKVAEAGLGHRPSIAADSKGLLHLAFEGPTTSGGAPIDYAQSGDGGKTWSGPVDVSKASMADKDSSPPICHSPRIASEADGAIDMVWSEKDTSGSHVFFARSGDAGKTWEKKIQLGSNLNGAATAPAIAVAANGKIHVVWTQASTGEADIFHAVSDNGGREWQKAENVTKTGSASGEPSLAVTADGTTHLVWPDTRKLSQQDIYYLKAENGTWSKLLNLSNTKAASSHPRLSVGRQDKLYVTWTDGSKKPLAPDIWCVHSTRKGGFSKPVNVSNSPGLSGHPAIASDAKGRVALVWSDTSRNDSFWDAIARLSNDELAEYSNLIILTESLSPGDARYPDVTIVKDDAVFVWEQIEHNQSKLKSASVNLREIASGPAERVYDQIHGVESNSR